MNKSSQKFVSQASNIRELHWPKIFAMLRKSKVESEKFSMVKNHPKISRLIFAFGILQNLPKILTKIFAKIGLKKFKN